MQVQKVRVPHKNIGCWWTLYDYGLDMVKTWDRDYEHPYPGASLASPSGLISHRNRTTPKQVY